MKARLGRTVAALIGAGLIATASTNAYAAFKVRITQGAASVTVTDNGAGDTNAAAGIVSWAGTVGVFNVTFTSGISKPVLGGTTFANMDLAGQTVSSAAGTLTLELTDTDFSLPGTAAGLRNLIGGTTQGTVAANACLDGANAEFGCPGTFQVANFGGGTSGPGAFSDDASVGVSPLPATFSLTEVVTFTHTGAQVSSFNKELRVATPEPGMLGLAGLGLAAAGLAGLRRRRRG